MKINYAQIIEKIANKDEILSCVISYSPLSRCHQPVWVIPEVALNKVLSWAEARQYFDYDIENGCGMIAPVYFDFDIQTSSKQIFGIDLGYQYGVGCSDWLD